MDVLREELKRQNDSEKWRNAYEESMGNILKKLQILLNQQKLDPERDVNYRKVLAVLEVGTGTRYVVRQIDDPHSTAKPSAIESLGTLDDAEASSRAITSDVMQKITRELIAIEHHKYEN
ncbi:hypothetical protein BOTBODRAFT_504948 [Botryobasidium botryosum FD-172 SS1]|uniref:Uncharacterized protein n=1 Tax=Botryobasidium botryosum (strain FD-172 SS1) TaxID=930990 RepID=A0A067M5A0_BOTB1|nr:hypothetical protein BOTBODRAFT_504948 [Botryobasidium botryosum FD-172 SS1]